MKKSIFTLFLALAASVGTIFAVTIDDIEYNLNEDELTAEVTTSFNSSYSDEIVIPSTVTYKDKKYSVTSIGMVAFANCSSLTSVIIPNSVTSIGDYAFALCSGLTSINIPASVTSIGDDAFAFVSNVVYSGTATGYPWGARSVNGYVDGWFVFSDNSRTTLQACFSYAAGVIDIPNSVTSIGYYAFYGCTDMTSVSIPNSVTSIGEGAFYECTGLTSIEIPNSVTNIGNHAFSLVPNIVYNGTATGSPWSAKCVNGFVDGFLVYADASKTTLFACSAVAEEVVIPHGVASIGENAFHGCSGLTSVTIPNSVTSIGNSAFDGCSGLTSVTIPSTVISIGNRAFFNVRNIVYDGTASGSPWGAKYVNGIADGYLVYRDDTKSTLVACSSTVDEVIIPNTVINIDDETFYDCRNLTSVTIPNSVTKIGQNAFFGCNSLKKVNISDLSAWCKIHFRNGGSPTTYAGHLYLNNVEITELVIPDDVSEISGIAFDGCNNLTSVTIHSNVTRIRESAFLGCRSLKKVNIYDLSAWCKIQFENASANPTCYAGHLYLNNTEIRGLVIPDDVSRIRDYAFYGCSGLTSVNIHEGVTSIGEGAFYGCSDMTSVSIPNSVTSIGNSAFCGCSDMTSVTIPNSVTSIGNYAFKGCIGLTSLTIPYSVTSIGYRAFLNCDDLIVIVERTTPPSIDTDIFSNSVQIFVPNVALTAYQSAKNWKDYSIKGFISQELMTSPTSCTITIIHNIWDVHNNHIVSVTIEGGESFSGNTLEYIGLEPNSEYNDIPVVLTSNTGETETINVSFSTPELELTTQPAHLTSESSAVIIANTNMADVETSCGFEFRRTGASDAVPSQIIGCPVANGTMAVKVKNLKAGTEYKYRPFYKSAAENMYYGDWTAFDPQDAYITYEPVIYTYAASAVTENEATLKGYALEGSDDFDEQGFEYWADSRVTSNNAPVRKSVIGEKQKIAASGIAMKVTLTDLDEGTVYKYRTYAKFGDQTVYGAEMSFTTKGEYQEPMAIDEISNDKMRKCENAKIIIGGHLFILRDGKTYTVTGAEVR